MPAEIIDHRPQREPITFSNAMRLTGRQWLGIGVFWIWLTFFAPSLWNLVEPFPDEIDYRMPDVLKQDYWFYRRFARHAAENFDVMVMGDSAVWGLFAKRDETLPHYLGDKGGGPTFVNLGLNGAHPLALEGLIANYAGPVRGKRVLLQCNLVWLNSPKTDLQDERVEDINHPALIPQFIPRIPPYKKDVAGRLSVLAQRLLPVSQWANHLQLAYFNGTDVPDWTMKHPYENPLGPLSQALPASQDKTPRQVPWNHKKEIIEDYPWVDLDTSLQWPAFQRVVGLLQGRGNRVFVLVGPFNEHLLTGESRQRLQKVKAAIAHWLKSNGIAHMVAAVLPSELYGDASHPLPAGYAKLAEQVLKNEDF